MGYDVQHIGFEIALRLDSHGGDKERRHEQMSKDIEREYRAALRPVLEKYREILMFEPSYYLGEEARDDE